MKTLCTLLVFCLFILPLEAYELKGRHTFGSYHECSEAALEDHCLLRQAFLHAIERAGLTPLSTCEQIFENGDYSLVVLMENSHASLHTNRLSTSCFADFFTFDPTISSKRFDHDLIDYLNPGLSNYNTIERN